MTKGLLILLWGGLALLLGACGNIPGDDTWQVGGKAEEQGSQTITTNGPSETFVDPNLDVLIYPNPTGFTLVYRKHSGLEWPGVDDAGRHVVEVGAGQVMKIVFVSGDGLRDDWICSKGDRSLPYERTVEEWVRGFRYIFSYNTSEKLAGTDLSLQFASDDGEALQKYDLILKFVGND